MGTAQRLSRDAGGEEPVALRSREDFRRKSGQNSFRILPAISTPIWEPSFDTVLLTSRPSGLEIANAVWSPQPRRTARRP
jgi:hypothetical protein